MKIKFAATTLMKALGVTTAAQLSRLINVEARVIAAALEAGEMEKDQAFLWAEAAGLNPEKLWNNVVEVEATPSTTKAKRPAPLMVPATPDKTQPAIPEGFEWVDEIPPARINKSTQSTADRLQFLRGYPNRWVNAGQRGSGKSAMEMVSRLRKQLGPGFDVTARPPEPTAKFSSPHNLYVRFVGTDDA